MTGCGSFRLGCGPCFVRQMDRDIDDEIAAIWPKRLTSTSGRASPRGRDGAARRSFGGVTQTKEAVAGELLHVVEDLARDRPLCAPCPSPQSGFRRGRSGHAGAGD
jgi:hypothetical protein